MQSHSRPATLDAEQMPRIRMILSVLEETRLETGSTPNTAHRRILASAGHAAPDTVHAKVKMGDKEN